MMNECFENILNELAFADEYIMNKQDYVGLMQSIITECQKRIENTEKI